MATFSVSLESIYRDGNNCKAFEHFAKWFLTHDPEWSTQADEVWLWDNWPDRWDSKKDLGTDFIFKHTNGELWAVQSKFYARHNKLSYADVNSFLNDSNRKSISRRFLISSTNRIASNAKEVLARTQGEKPVTNYMREHFESAKVDYPSDYKDLRNVKKKGKPGARPYQEIIIQNVVKGFKKADHGQLIVACGVVKTFTTLWIKEQMKSQKNLGSPSFIKPSSTNSK